MILTDLKNYKFNCNLIIKKNGETIMAYNPANGDMYEMNEISIFLIEKLMLNLTGEYILKEICKEYNVNEETVIEDVAPLLERLKSLNLLIID